MKKLQKLTARAVRNEKAAQRVSTISNQQLDQVMGGVMSCPCSYEYNMTDVTVS